MADNASFFHDTRPPFMVDDLAAVTLATTAKALYGAGSFPTLGQNYWSFAGKRMWIRMFGKITTAATPGNGSFDVYWGTGADANGTILVSSAAQTLIASQTNISWRLSLSIRCVTPGAAGALYCVGEAQFGAAVIAVSSFLIPASAAAKVTALDLSAAGIVSVQFKRTGSTAETMTVQDLEVSPGN